MRSWNDIDVYPIPVWALSNQANHADDAPWFLLHSQHGCTACAAIPESIQVRVGFNVSIYDLTPALGAILKHSTPLLASDK